MPTDLQRTRSINRVRCLAFYTSLFGVFSCLGPAALAETLPADPANARYEIEGETVSLVDGRTVTPAAPGSAILVRTGTIGKPVFGDLDGDGDNDAVIWLVHQPGGSGTFYYAALAIKETGGFRGTRAVRIGDRIVPGELSIGNRILTVRFADRSLDQPMTANPEIEKAWQFSATPAGLASSPAGAVLLQKISGWLVLGHEVRSFQPCGDARPLWVTGGTGALQRVYRQALSDAAPYTPWYVTLAGFRLAQPAGGFGADYSGSFRVVELVDSGSIASCTAEIIITEPEPNRTIASPLRVRGKAHGSWFFEGEVGLVLLDDSRKVVARGFATALSDWMTDDLVDFAGTLAFDRIPIGNKGFFVVNRNNPSDNRSLDRSVEILVRFR